MPLLPHKLRLGLGMFLASTAAFAASAPEGLRILNSDIVRVVYPHELAWAGADATVEVSYRVAPSGAAVEAEVVRSSHADAAAAVLAALDEMVFETEYAGERPVLSEPQTLRLSLREVQLASDLEFIGFLRNSPAAIVGAREVDGGLRPAALLAPPVFPSSLRSSRLQQGKAVLEFYVDSGGIVRLPRVLSATHPAFGWSAASAALTWRFTPPRQGGRPVTAKVTGLPVTFTAPPPSPLDAPAQRPLLGAGAFAVIRIDSATKGSKVKVNGALSDILPTNVVLEVDEGGFAIKRYVIALSLNLLPAGVPRGLGPEEAVANLGSIIIEQGQAPPARIYFELDGPQAYGTAKIERTR